MASKSNRILAMLKADHKKVKALFSEYEKADSRKQQAIAQTVIQELDIHAELEEQLIYPAPTVLPSQAVDSSPSI